MPEATTTAAAQLPPPKLTPETLPAPEWWPEAVAALVQPWLEGQGLEAADELSLTLTPEPLDGAVRLILAQQNTRPAAQRQWAALKAAYPVWEAALLSEPDELEAVLKSAGGGLSRSKARRIYTLLRQLRESRGPVSLHYLHALPDAEARAQLETLSGIGRRSASLLLLFHLGRPAAAANTGIARVLTRLEVVPPNWDAAKCERWLERTLPHSWPERAAFHRAGVALARSVCRPQPQCAECPLLTWCATGQSEV